ncbi:hypothetical protein CTEN210_12022 [Chaetoceros tenuissimus]|uniref:Uncharacterized protein n=1 Tax=Chaetoceros tenuissimus TaxID=426638 RepID=A0AAD3H9V1_9STRA|nr:hypothetical protein CTEN210_12022 [Chaetoceros tenuissimus]
MRHGLNVRVPLVLPLEHSQQNIKRNNKVANTFYIPNKPSRREGPVKESQSNWAKKRQKDTSTQTCLYCESKESQTSPVVSKAQEDKDNVPCLSELAGAQHILQDIQELFNHDNDESDNIDDTDLQLYDINARLALEDIRQRHNHQIQYSIFKAWRESCIHYKRERVEQEMKDVQHFKIKRKSIVTALAGVTIGSNQEKKILNRCTNALKQARETLVKKLEKKNQAGGIITEAMLQVELQKIFHDEIQAWDRKRYLRPPFQWMKRNARKMHLLKRKADNYRGFRALYKSFQDWRSSVAKSRQVPLRYSQIVVDAFIDKRRMKLSFKVWHKWSMVMTLAKKLERKILSRQAWLLFQSWSDEARKRVRLRRKVLDKWMAYRYRYTKIAFQRWDAFSRYAACLEAGSAASISKASSGTHSSSSKVRSSTHSKTTICSRTSSKLYESKADKKQEFRSLKQPTLIRGSNYNSTNSTLPSPKEIAAKLNVQPTKEASAKQWQLAWKFHKKMIPILHSTDYCKPPDSSLNLACMWWKALSGNDISSPVYDDQLAYDLLPSGWRKFVSRRVRKLYPRLHHGNVELRTAYLDDAVEKEVEYAHSLKQDYKIRLLCMGAGYDTRGIKMLERKLVDEVMELDLEQVVQAKERLFTRLLKRRPWLKDLKMPILVPSDFNRVEEVKQVLNQVIDDSMQGKEEEWYTIFVFEGVMIYLNDGAPSSLLNITSSALSEKKLFGSLCLADRLENVPGGDEVLGIVELEKNGWNIMDWSPKPGLARHMLRARLIPHVKAIQKSNPELYWFQAFVIAFKAGGDNDFGNNQMEIVDEEGVDVPRLPDSERERRKEIVWQQ